MYNLLTLEDYNSVNVDYINEYYELDTSKISMQEFSNIRFDFSIVSHEINGNEHEFSFEIHNNLWCGGYWFTKTNGEYIDSNASYENDILTFTTSESSVILHLYLCNFADRFDVMRLQNIITNENNGIFIVPINTENVLINVLNVKSGDEQSVELPISVGVKDTQNFYLLCLIKKTDLVFNLNTNVTAGVVNRVRLNVDNDYLPNGDLVGEDELDIVVNYGDLEIPVTYDESVNDYCFNLDLGNKFDNKNIKISVLIAENNLIANQKLDFVLSCNYPTASNLVELNSLLVKEVKIVDLSGDIDLTNNLILINDIVINGNGFKFNMDYNSINIENNTIIKINNIKFDKGKVCFVQKNNSKLVINNCTFTNCEINDNYKGSIISSISNDVETEFYNCKSVNCHHSIYHGGLLTVKNSEFLYNDWSNKIDTDYSAFLTAYEGIVEIGNSIFDVDYDTDLLCSNEIDSKYAISLISVGTDTSFNGVMGVNLKSNETLPLFTGSYNNESHVFCKYFYPEIEDCVYISPVKGKENKSVCHSVIGTDWVFKNNVEISKVSDGNENNIRLIKWE